LAGSGFVPTSQVEWNGKALATTYNSSTSLAASISASEIAEASSAAVSVVSPAPGGGTSGTLTFTVSAPSLPNSIVASLSPSSVNAGAGEFLLTVGGTGFVPATRIVWNGSIRQSTFISANELTVTIPQADIASVGAVIVKVVNTTTSLTEYSNGLIFLIDGPATNRTVQAVSIDPSGQPGNGNSSFPAISSNGRYVAFISNATNLVVAGANGHNQVFLRDTCAGMPTGCVPSTSLVSVGYDGSVGNSDSGAQAQSVSPPSISADGRFVAFRSWASNLVLNDTNNVDDIFMRDTCNGVQNACAPITLRVSVANDGAQADGYSRDPSISPDGRFVAFASRATNLIQGVQNGNLNIFVRDTCVGGTLDCESSTIAASLSAAGALGNADSYSPSISSGGDFVAFTSQATNLSSNTSNAPQIFLRSTCVGASVGCTAQTRILSVDQNGTPGNSLSEYPALSANAQYVVFMSMASNLVSGSGNGADTNILLANTCAQQASICVASITGVSTATLDSDEYMSSASPSISSNGRFIGYDSFPVNFTTGLGGIDQTFVYDTCEDASGCTQATVLTSVSASGQPGNFNSGLQTISGDGHFVAFVSGASNLTPNGNGSFSQVYLLTTPYF
jgi:Tol biopolymer transport system component